MRRQAVLLCALAAMLPLLSSSAEARGFGGGGFRGGGFSGGGFRGADGRAGGYRFSGGGEDAWRGGYRGEHPLYGPGARPAVDGDRDSFNRVTVNNNFYNRDLHGWNDAWRGGGYWNNRPWIHGWYGGWGDWGWWGPSAAAWGVAGLATGAAIGSLVNAAADQQAPVIVVPDTTIQLNYGSVESVGSAGVSFNYSLDGNTQLIGAANCQQGLLDGQVPATLQQAQLLNAVCQVAYGTGS